ncbi:MAG TPA: bifunctional adenosylcobinamide kinase/adenosylcobinamide-phosphate guanylyltransferase [Acidimicrobiales bacterium]|jgi:adenosyl cobinamide kinase/adenosyl cobinamide phosphate guanylyltransferase|nr:bifunctional adenosylcobinamide kinase/adenosylcobinamide-phosphate guanylyltransferase [Acidimicrobiales bacterium]
MITLVLGGARSGKSAVAERLVARHLAPVTYVATMVVGESRELGLRVAAHRARRPPEWSTVESGTGLAPLLGTLTGAALVDSLGPWLAAHPDFAVDSEELCASLVARQGDTVLVSDEVGLSVHPSAESGRRFRDAMGSLNQAVASVADEVVLVVAGRVLPLKPVEDH